MYYCTCTLAHLHSIAGHCAHYCWSWCFTIVFHGTFALYCSIVLCKGVKGVLVLESIAHYCSYALYCTVLVLQAIALHCTPVYNCTIALLKGSYYWTPCTIAGWCRVSLRGVGVVGIRGAAGGTCIKDLLLFSNCYFQQTWIWLILHLDKCLRTLFSI